MRRVLLLLLLATCAAAADGPQRITVLCYNIRHGMGMDGKIDLQRTAAVIRSGNPDVAALQEVDRHTARSGNVDQAAELARLTGMKHVFGRSIDYEDGDYGNAVLSRLPIRASAVHPLPGQEPRSLLEVTLAAGSGMFLFFDTHLDATRPEDLRKEAAEKIVALVAKRGDQPALLAGDLNSVLERDALKVLRTAWTIAGGDQERPTVPVESPRRQIDFILYRPEGRWKTVEVRVLDEKVASDHRPIVAILELTGN